MDEQRASMEYANDCVTASIECGFGHPDELMKEWAVDAFLHGAAYATASPPKEPEEKLPEGMIGYCTGGIVEITKTAPEVKSGYFKTRNQPGCGLIIRHQESLGRNQSSHGG